MKECPYCAEDIKEGAIKCKHCGSVLSEKETPTASNKSKQSMKNSPQTIGCAVLLVIVFIFGVSFCSNSGGSGSGSIRETSKYVLKGDRAYINIDVHAAVTEEDAELLTNYMLAKNDNGIVELMVTGNVFLIKENTEVNVVDTNLSLAKISSPEGTGWVPLEFVTKK